MVPMHAKSERRLSLNWLASRISILLEIILCAGIIGWVFYHWLKKSDYPARLISKWAVKSVMGGITWWVVASNMTGEGGYGAACSIGITCVICGHGLEM